MKPCETVQLAGRLIYIVGSCDVLCNTVGVHWLRPCVQNPPSTLGMRSNAASQQKQQPQPPKQMRLGLAEPNEPTNATRTKPHGLQMTSAM